MRIGIEVTGDMREIMEREIGIARRAISGGVRQAAGGLQNGWRGQVKGAGLGARLANTIRRSDFPAPPRESMDAASLVYARPNRGRGASAATLIDVFDRGVTIRSRDGFWLAIPLPAAGGARFSGDRRITPGRWEQRTGRRLRFVFRRGRPSLLVADLARVNRAGVVTNRRVGSVPRSKARKGDQTVPVFILVPQVRLRKRIDLDRDTARWERALPGLILAKWPD